MGKIDKFQAIEESREIGVLNELIQSTKLSATARLHRDNNRVNWSIGKHNAIVRVDRVHSDTVLELPCNERKPLIEQVYTVSIDTFVPVAGVEQRVIRRIASIGFTHADSDGNRSAYLLTGGGKLATQSSTGESQTILADGMGFVLKAADKATIHDDSHFFNTPIARSQTRAVVVSAPFKFA